MKWKVCGMRDEENILKVSALEPDYIGFIFYGNSERNVKPESLISILPNLDEEIKKVGVFVNEEIDTIMKTVSSLHLDFVQLHGEESVAYVNSLVHAGVRVVKAFHVDSGFDWSIVDAYAKLVSFFLFDAKGTKYGGNGFSFDWDLLSNYTLDVPYFLSGGLDLLSVEEALQRSFPNLVAIDVNSRFEDSPGIKNIELLKKLKTQLNK